MINLAFIFKSDFRTFIGHKSSNKNKKKMKLSTLLAATVSAANIDRRVDIDVITGELTEFRSESGRFFLLLDFSD